MAAEIVEVAVPVPLPQTFDYRAPGPVPAGARVRIPFGRRTLIGIVVGRRSEPRGEPEVLKAIEAVLDEQALIDPHLMALGRWLSDYYHHPLGDVLQTMLPVALRRGAPAKARRTPHWRLTANGAAVDPQRLGRAVRQRAVLLTLAEGLLDEPTLRRSSGADAAVLAAVADKGWIEQARPEPETGSDALRPTLNPAQAAAVSALQAARGFAPFLLHGVTGSGKTEVYLSAIEPVVGGGGQALVLVPEIGLTPQLIRRFSRRFGDRVAALHSGLADAERLDVWVRARAGEIAVVIGTRSALFTPLPDLQLVVVDEEHDGSFKQNEGLRYSARDAAVKRAQLLDVPVVLGTATPSLESLRNAVDGRYAHLRLPERAGPATPPSAEVIDLRPLEGDDGLSPMATRRMADHLDRGEQVLVFLNRRGYSPVLMCRACGWYGECRRCDARLTYHRRDRSLRCHHCGWSRRAPELCGECGSARVAPVGQGTERLEERVGQIFPDIPLVRLDRDTIRSQSALEAALAVMRRGDPAILIGTQMLAKGHDFPNVTLAVIVNLDQPLFSGDFRAPEHAAQLLVQVAGRTGRAEKPGTLLLQTRHPEHPLFGAVLTLGYDAYAMQLLNERRAAVFPPYGHLAVLRAEAPQRADAAAFLEEVTHQAAVPAPVQLYGPMPCAMERRAGRYRLQVLLQSAERGPLHAFLRDWLPFLYRSRLGRKTRWSLDLDPLDGV